MTLFMGLQKIMPTEIRTTVVPYPGYTVTFNNNDKSHQTITAQLEPTWKTTDYTDTNLDDFVAGAENVGVKLHLYVNAAPGYAHGALSWSPNTFINGGMLTGPLTVNATNATPIADVVIPTGYEDYYLHNSTSRFYEDTNYDNYKTTSQLSGNIIIFDLDNYLTKSSSISLRDMFGRSAGPTLITSLDLSNLDTSKANDMSSMFINCSNMTSLNVSNFNTSNVTNMGNMFSSCSSLTSLNVSNFNTSNVTSMVMTFSYCRNLISLDLSNWNTNNVVTMQQMFDENSSLTSVNVSNFNTSNVTNMQSLFYNCKSLTSIDLSSFNTSKVTNMYGTFWNCSALTSVDMSNWDTSNASSNSNTFYGCNNLKYLIIGSNTFKFQAKSSIQLPNNCKILVPQALISTYQNATNWSTHASKFDAIENYTITRSNGQVTVTPKFSGCCVPYYTEIKYADNTIKQADKVKVGDKLIGYNINSQTFEEIEVLKVTEILRNDLLRITTKSNKILDLSVDHPLLSEDGWASLNPELTNSVYSDVSIPEDNKLRIGMKLLTEDGYDEIIKIDLLPQNELIKTYTYDVTNGIDTYITNGFISHNHY